MEELQKKLEEKTKQKLRYEKLYWEAHDELVAHGIRKPSIQNDLSHN